MLLPLCIYSIFTHLSIQKAFPPALLIKSFIEQLKAVWVWVFFSAFPPMLSTMEQGLEELQYKFSERLENVYLLSKKNLNKI